MTLAELKIKINEFILEFGEDMDVHIAYPAGDYFKTTLAPTIKEVEAGHVKDCEYHGKPSLVDPDEVEVEELEQKCKQVIVIS